MAWQRTRGANSAAMLAVSSSEPSSTTWMSKVTPACATTDSRVARRYRAAL